MISNATIMRRAIKNTPVSRFSVERVTTTVVTVEPARPPSICTVANQSPLAKVSRLTLTLYGGVQRPTKPEHAVEEEVIGSGSLQVPASRRV